MLKIAKRRSAKISVNDLLAIKSFVKVASLPMHQEAFRKKITNLLRRIETDMRLDKG